MSRVSGLPQGLTGLPKKTGEDRPGGSTRAWMKKSEKAADQNREQEDDQCGNG